LAEKTLYHCVYVLHRSEDGNI